MESFFGKTDNEIVLSLADANAQLCELRKQKEEIQERYDNLLERVGAIVLKAELELEKC